MKIIPYNNFQSRSDDTLLTVSFNLRSRDKNSDSNQNIYQSRSDGTLPCVRRLKSTVNRVPSLRDWSRNSLNS